MIKFLQQVQSDYNAFKNNYDVYARNVKAISGDFGLQHGSHLQHDELPTYWAGNLADEREKIAIIGINPKYDARKIAFENAIRMKSWQDYVDFHNNFFKYYKSSEFNINYYQSIAGALADKVFKEKTYFDFCDENVLNLDIIPYHSASFNVPALGANAKHYLLDRFYNDVLPFMVRKPNITRAIIHDKRLAGLLIKEGYIDASHVIHEKHIKGGGRQFVYRKVSEGLELFVFSRFIPVGGFSKREVFDALYPEREKCFVVSSTLRSSSFSHGNMKI